MISGEAQINQPCIGTHHLWPAINMDLNGNSLDDSGIWKSITRLMWFGFPKAQIANGLEKGIQVFFAAATMGPVSVFAAGAG